MSPPASRSWPFPSRRRTAPARAPWPPTRTCCGSSVTTVYPGYVRTSIHDERDAQLDDVIRSERLEDVTQAIVRACLEGHRRDTATTPRGGWELWLARHFPSLVERAVARRLRSAIARRGRSGLVDRHANAGARADLSRPAREAEHPASPGARSPATFYAGTPAALGSRVAQKRRRGEVASFASSPATAAVSTPSTESTQKWFAVTITAKMISSG